MSWRRTGIVPLDLSRDIGGPIGRTVRDVAKLFTYITGYDATDPLTNLSTTPGAVPAGGYEQFLVAGSLKVCSCPISFRSMQPVKGQGTDLSGMSHAIRKCWAFCRVVAHCEHLKSHVTYALEIVKVHDNKGGFANDVHHHARDALGLVPGP